MEHKCDEDGIVIGEGALSGHLSLKLDAYLHKEK